MAEVPGQKFELLETEKEPGGTRQRLSLLENEKELGNIVGSERGGTIGSKGGTMLMVEAACMVRGLFMKGRHLHLP